jgi:hypothetical protein
MRRCQVEKRSSTDGREDWGGSSKLSIQLSQRGSPKAKGRGKSQRRRRWWVSAGRSGRTVSGSVVATIFMSIHHGHRSAQRAGPCWFGFHGSNQEPMLAPEARQGRGRAGRGKASDPMRKECQPLGLQQAAGFWAREEVGGGRDWVWRSHGSLGIRIRRERRPKIIKKKKREKQSQKKKHPHNQFPRGSDQIVNINPLPAPKKNISPISSPQGLT